MAEGIEGRLVEVEADILQGLSAFNIVGLGDTAVQEAKERIRSAIKNSGAKYPQQKKVINLAPADLKKHGPHFDLPMAVSLLAASDQMKIDELKNALIVGELALDGSVRPVNGVLTMALFAKKNGWKKIVVPLQNLSEALAVKNIAVIGVKDLKEFMEKANAHSLQEANFPPTAHSHEPINMHSQILTPISTHNPNFQPLEGKSENLLPTIDDVKGHALAKRALMISAAGGHHLLFTGSPGVGKTLLAKSLPSILPPMNEEEMLEVMQIYSAAGFFKNGVHWLQQRPFREVHSSCSLPALIGGGTTLVPGEISLAHHGVLFLDEIPEFPRSHIEVLRQPLEAKEIHLSRVSGSLKYPAHFTLVASMNPCPCGFFGDPVKECQCRPYQIIQYQRKLSGPIMDRIDLMVEVERQPLKNFSDIPPPSEKNQPEFLVDGKIKKPANPSNKTRTQLSSKNIQKNIIEARKIQQLRFKKNLLNSDMKPAQFRIYCRLDSTCQDFIEEAGEKLNFSGRNYHQILKISRTIADLNRHEAIQLEDLTESLQYRLMRN